MKKVTILLILLACSATLSFGQTDRINAANKMWTDYDRVYTQTVPPAVPNSLHNVDVKWSATNRNELQTKLNELVAGNGGILRFDHGGSNKTIYFNEPITIREDWPSRHTTKTITIQCNNKITFDGNNNSSLFIIRGNVRVIFQDAIFKKAKLKGVSKDNLNSIQRTGGGAIEVRQMDSRGASLRVRNCQFLNNEVAHFWGIGENQNGAAIRLHNKSTCEVFDCLFKNNRAVSGGAIGGTSIKKLTVLNSVFNDNKANGYVSNDAGRQNVVEGAGAIRIDRTAEAIEIYGSAFINNKGRTKVSAVEIFLRDVGGGNYPGGTAVYMDNCRFKGNKHLGYGGTHNANRKFFNGPMLVHSGETIFSSVGKLDMRNTVFEENEVGQANLTLMHYFELRNCKFVKTSFLGQGLSKVEPKLRSAVAINNTNNSGLIENCTFFENEPVSGMKSNDIWSAFWQHANNVTIRKCIFYRKNNNKNIRVTTRTFNNGKDNIQYTAWGNSSEIAKVTKNGSDRKNPEISTWYSQRWYVFGQNFWSIEMCKKTGYGGLWNCSGRTTKTQVSVKTTLEEAPVTLALYPNPTTGSITVQGLKTGDDIIIRDVQLRTALKMTVHSTTETIDVTHLKPGMYLLSVNGKMLRFIKK